MSSQASPSSEPPPPRVPERVCDKISFHANQSTRKNLRLVSRKFCETSSEHLFRRLNVLSDAKLLKSIEESNIPGNVRELNIWQNKMIKHFTSRSGNTDHPFVNVTTVFLGFCRPPTAAETRDVWKFLFSFPKLEHLSFSIQDHRTRDYRTREYRAWDYRTWALHSTADMLQPVQGTWHRPRRLCYLKLTGTMAGVSLSMFLLSIQSTLRGLELYRCELFNPQDHWPTVLNAVRAMQSLRQLELDELKDPQDVYLPKGLRKCKLFEDFRQNVCDYLLRRRGTVQWNDVEIVKLHMDQQNYLEASEHGMNCIWDSLYLRKAERILQENTAKQ